MQESGKDRMRVVTGACGSVREEGSEREREREREREGGRKRGRKRFFLSRGKREAGKAVGLKKVWPALTKGVG